MPCLGIRPVNSLRQAEVRFRTKEHFEIPGCCSLLHNARDVGQKARDDSGQSTSASILHSQSTSAIEGGMTYTPSRMYKRVSRAPHQCIIAIWV
jgi:hypothetical protein